MAVSDHKVTDGDDVSDDCGLEEPLIEPRERQDASFAETNDTGLSSSPDEAGPGTAPVVSTVARSAGELPSVTAEWDNQHLWIVLWLVFSVVTLLLSILVFPVGLLPLFGSSLGIIGSSLYFALRSTRHSIGESVKIISRLALIAAVINVGFTGLMVLILLTVPCPEEDSVEEGAEGDEEVDEDYCGRAKTALFLLTSWFGFHGFVSSTVAYNLRSVLKLLSPLSQGVVLDIAPEPIPDV